jgi:hypothetical protein
MVGCSSGITTYLAVQGLATASLKNCRIAGPLRSSYTPLLARSLTVTTPNVAASPMLLLLPPDRGGGAAGVLLAPGCCIARVRWCCSRVGGSEGVTAAGVCGVCVRSGCVVWDVCGV